MCGRKVLIPSLNKLGLSAVRTLQRYTQFSFSRPKSGPRTGERAATMRRRRYEIHRPPDGKWGSLINGTWNGMIGMIHRQEVDLAMGGMTISLARRQVVDFSPAYCFDRTTFVTRAPSENSKAWVIVFPFQWTVWLAITLAVFTEAFNLLMSENCFHLYTSAQGIREDEEKKSNDKFVYLKAVVLLLKGIVAQDSYVPNTHPGRFLMATWWIFVVTIITAYSGTLTSFMANPGTQESLDTIDKLVDKIKAGTFSCGVIKDSSDHNLFKNPQSEAFAVILNNMESRPENFVTSDKEGLAKCFKENYAYLGGHLTVDADIQHIQKFQFARDNFQISGYGIAHQKGSYFRNAFDKTVLKLRQSGLVDKWIQEALNKVRKKNATSEEISKRPLKINDVQGAFHVLCIGHGLSIGIFLVERLCPQCLNVQ
ncbi:putative glutamate receptor [Tachypleus tridentatus]|uniref:putative glutamate receptor n=1 Tax=Tachypleus tridentatus TaxID=6853 RepID=UPI003FD140E1